MDHAKYIDRIRSYIKTPTQEMKQQLDDFCNLCTYVSGQYDRDDSFQNLDEHLNRMEDGRKEAHRLFYMALPPSVFTIVSQHLKRCCYPTRGIARVVVCIPRGLVIEALLYCLAPVASDSNTLSTCYRSRSRSEKTLPAPASSKSRSSPTGMKMSFSALTITSARKW